MSSDLVVVACAWLDLQEGEPEYQHEKSGAMRSRGGGLPHSIEEGSHQRGGPYTVSRSMPVPDLATGNLLTWTGTSTVASVSYRVLQGDPSSSLSTSPVQEW